MDAQLALIAMLDEIEFRCMTAGATAVLYCSVVASAYRIQKTWLFGCDLDYAPFPANWMPPALVKRGGADLPFLDPDGLAHYPVDTSQINDAQVVIVTYVPKVHFNRQLVMPPFAWSIGTTGKRNPLSTDPMPQ